MRAIGRQIAKNFLGSSPNWYKLTIFAFLVVNVFSLQIAGKHITGWLILIEFIFTLTMALRCYPLAPGGLIAIQAILIKLTTAGHVFQEVENNFEVIMLLIFMVAGVFFLKDLLLFIFSNLLVSIRSKRLLSLTFCATAALLSAFLDALTVTAVIIAVIMGFYTVYHKVASGVDADVTAHDPTNDDNVIVVHGDDLVQFRWFLRSLVMHAAIGTALGGVCTIVGEPQNLLIASLAGWDFYEFFIRMAPVSMPVLVTGLVTCVLLEQLGWFSYGTLLPEPVRSVLVGYVKMRAEKRTDEDNSRLLVQGVVVLFLVISLAFHLAEVGMVGLGVIVLISAFTGIIEEKRLGQAFHEALPFTALLVVFFAIVAVISDQGLFAPIINEVLALPRNLQTPLLFVVNGTLSAISDNVFVATVYMNEIKAALDNGVIDRALFERLAIAVNTGTNIPSVATPNGQAAFLFLLTSSLAPIIRLSYGRMVFMALPYLVTMTAAGLAAIVYLLP